jgi:hypothetical protein
MYNSNIVYHIDQSHTYEASWHGIDSAYLFNSYKLTNSSFLELYSPRDLDKKSFINLSNLFCVIYAQNYYEPSNRMFHSLKPLYILRFMIHDDLTVSEYDTPRRKLGNVVEALCWSNGMIFRTRQDAKEQFKIFQYGIFLSSNTATLMGINHDTNS